MGKCAAFVKSSGKSNKPCVDDFFWVSYLTIDIFKQTLSNMDRDIDAIINKYNEMVKQSYNKWINEMKKMWYFKNLDKFITSSEER